MEQGNTPIRGLDSTAPGIHFQGLYVKLQNKNWTNFKMQPNKTHIHNHYLFRETVSLENSPNSACFWTEEGNQKPTQTLGEHSNSIQKHHQSPQARTASPPLTPFNQKDNIYCSSYLWLWDEGSSRDGEAVVDLAEILSHDGQTTPLSAACACRQPLEWQDKLN